jgi:hypothetical protein
MNRQYRSVNVQETKKTKKKKLRSLRVFLVDFHLFRINAFCAALQRIRRLRYAVTRSL